MPAPLQQTATIRLEARREATFRGLAERLLRVRRGAAWITQHRDACDYIVAAGDEVRIAGDGAVIVQALTDVVIDVMRPAPVSRARAALRAIVGAVRRPPVGAPASHPVPR